MIDVKLRAYADPIAAWSTNAWTRHLELESGTDPAYRALTNRILNYLVQSPLRAGSRILDAGTGTGALAAELFAHGFDVTGIDPSINSIEIARDSYIGPRFLANSLQDHHGDQKYEAIVANMTLHCVENLQSFMRAASENLTPKGSLYATIPNPHTYLQTRDDIDVSDMDLRVEQTLDIPFRIRNHEPHPSLVRFYHRPVRSYSVSAQNAGMRIDDFDIPLHVGPGRPRDIAIIVFSHQADQPLPNVER